MRLRTHAVVMVAALLVGSSAFAHEVLHSVERGRAIAVKAFFADGEPLAYTEYQLFSPADAKIPYQKGRTDRSGYVAFMPDVPGNWHVRITESGGHGLDVDVAALPPGRDSGQQAASTSTGIATWAFALRPLLGVVLIGALFIVLIALYRKKGTRK
jgi:nickel transport protein